MRRPLVRVVACLVIVASVIGIWPDPGPHRATAQQSAATPALMTTLPAGISAKALAAGAAPTLPSVPFHLRLDQLSMAPGPAATAQPAPGPQLYYVQSGTLSVVDELGIEGDYPQGTSILIPMGARIEIHNSGKQPVGLLHLSLLPSSGSSAPPVSVAAASTMPTGSATPVASGTNTIFDAEIKQAPTSPAVLFLYRVTWQPGSVLDSDAFSGPVGVAVESGVLTVAGPSGVEGQLRLGTGIVFPAGVTVRQRNAGATPTVALMAGILPANASVLSAGTSANATVVGPVGTAASTPVIANGGPSVQTTATASVTPGGVLYSADAANNGFAKWTVPQGWAVYRGMLINNGGGGELTVPYVPPVADYAVEVEVQSVLENDQPFIIGVRDGTVSADVYTGSGNHDLYQFQLFVGSDQVASRGSSRSFDAREWHTIRFQVEGNQMLLLVDGQPVAEDTDNRLIASGSGGQITLSCSSGMQLNLRSVKVIALGSDGGPIPTGTAASVGDTASGSG